MLRTTTRCRPCSATKQADRARGRSTKENENNTIGHHNTATCHKILKAKKATSRKSAAFQEKKKKKKQVSFFLFLTSLFLNAAIKQALHDFFF
jgi:hypothetical protein